MPSLYRLLNRRSRTWSHGVTDDDIYYCYRLFLRRPPDPDGLALFGVNYFCRLASTISAGSGSSWIEINNNNIDPVGGVGGAERRPKRGGKRAGSTEHAGTASGRVFHAAGTIHRGARIGDGPRAHDVDRRRARGNNGPGVRPRGAGAGGDFRRDRSVR